MTNYRRRRHTYSRERTVGHERALQHIREGRALSTLLGGTDEKVKRYLFNLPKSELRRVIAEYGRIHGQSAKEYAERTLPLWRSGRVTMSGIVAERLYRLLPPRMSISDKFDLAEELWRHVGPSSEKSLRFGKLASHSELVHTVVEYISAVVHGYQIPETLQRRFNWLAANDVKVKQQLLNHLQELDKRLVTEASSLQITSMLNHLSNENAAFTHSYSHTVKVGKHQLKLVADKDFEGYRLEDGIRTQRTLRTKGGDYSWLLWVLVAGAVILYFVLTE